MFRFLFFISHYPSFLLNEAALKKKATWKQSSNPSVCSFAYIHSSYTLILHVYTKILYIRACFRDEAKISRVRKWVSFVILITQRREKKMHCIFSKWNKCVFIFHEGHWRECHSNIRVLLLIRTFPRLKFLSKCVVQYCVWVHVGWKCSRMLAI